MVDQPQFPYRVEFNLEVPIDRNASGDPEGRAFDVVRVEVMEPGGMEPGGMEPRGIANASVYRVRSHAGVDYAYAARELGESSLLEDVCAEAIEAKTGLAHEVFGESLNVIRGDSLVIDGVAFVAESDDNAVMRGLLVRCVLDTLGRGDELLFLPGGSRVADLWARSVGAVRVGHFWVASAGLVRPEFPIEAVD